MANWAHVTDQNVDECHDILPANWQNISNLFALENDLESLAQFGWYKVLDVTQPLTEPGQTYGDVVYTFDSTSKCVIQNSPIINNSTAVNLDSIFQEQRDNFMQTLRNGRDARISACDWTMLPDVVANRSAIYPDWQSLWSTYRQSLRDLPQYYDDKYPDMIDQAQITYPDPPAVS